MCKAKSVNEEYLKNQQAHQWVNATDTRWFILYLSN